MVLQIAALDVDVTRGPPRVAVPHVQIVTPTAARVAAPDGGDPTPAAGSGRAVQAVALDPIALRLTQATGPG